MDNQYLVIKLSGGATEREQIKQDIKMLVGDNNVLNDENIATFRCVEAIPNHLVNDDLDNVVEHIKEKIAICIGKHLFESRLISFDQCEDVDDIKIGATITVIGEDIKKWGI